MHKTEEQIRLEATIEQFVSPLRDRINELQKEVDGLQKKVSQIASSRLDGLPI